MDKLKTSFVVKVDAEVSLNMAEVEIVKQKKEIEFVKNFLN